METNFGVNSFLKSISQEIIVKKTKEFLEARGIAVRLEGQVPKGGLVVANHPTD